MSHTISIPSFAKINLLLHVTGKRDDGYHTLNTIFQTIGIHDDLTFTFSPSDRFSVELDVGNSPIPGDHRNIIHRACAAFNEATGTLAAVRVDVKKRIPVEAGLGGGSSNAAATLIALSRFWDWPLPMPELTRIARNLGADVPFFLHGGAAFGSGAGDEIEPLPDLEKLKVLVVSSETISCSTAEIYREYDDFHLLTRRSDSINIREDLRPESLRKFVSQIENDLEQVVFARFPELDSTKKRLLSAGAIGAGMSGSGSCVFGLFSEAADLDKISKQFQGSYRTEFISRAEYSSAMGIK